MEEKTATWYRWEDMPKEEVSETLGRRLITGDRMMLAHVYLKKGSIVPQHSHENEQLTYILSGALKFWIGKEKREQIVSAGEVLVIPSNVLHMAEALEDTLDVDIFDPPRQDWLDKTDDYLREIIMDFGLKGKTALVCAASQGLGLAVAREIAHEGASIVICSRRPDAIESAAESIRSETGADVLALAADVSVAADIERLMAAGIERFGKIDILVTNSGGPPAGPFDSLTRESWDDATRILLTSVVELTKLVLPGMRERRWGRILNVTSIASKQPVDNLMLSNSLRAAVTGFAKTLANEVAADGVTVNNILPGYTLTERLDELIDFLAAKESLSAGEIRGRWEAEIPMRRLGNPKEFAALAAFLVSERASYITGSSIAVDGGWIKSLF